jgi:hypothetical protein
VVGDQPFYASKPRIVRLALSTAVVVLATVAGLVLGMLAAWSVPVIHLSGGLTEGNPGALLVSIVTWLFASFIGVYIGLTLLWRS